MAAPCRGRAGASDRRPRTRRRGSGRRQRKKTEGVTQGLPGGGQRQCLFGRLSNVGKGGQSETFPRRKNSERKEAKEPPTQARDGSQERGRCESQLESVE